VRLFSYVVRWDHGFAPNPFYALCTLATCKPGIRATAKIGDLVLGTGSAARKLKGRMVFLMRVGRIISFDEYWCDPQFARRIPVMNGSLQQRFGDNIYHRVKGKWVQADSRHSQGGARPNLNNLRRDTGKTDRVLIGSEFTYWGGDGPHIPKRFSAFVHSAPGYRAFFSEKDIGLLLTWLGSAHGRGLLADPTEWKFEKSWR
jgi:Nucleotide modification associated domain 2